MKTPSRLLQQGVAAVASLTDANLSKQVYGQFTPVMKINGSAAGITFAGTTLGEFWRDGRFVEVLYRIVLTTNTTRLRINGRYPINL